MQIIVLWLLRGQSRRAVPHLSATVLGAMLWGKGMQSLSSPWALASSGCAPQVVLLAALVCELPDLWEALSQACAYWCLLMLKEIVGEPLLCQGMSSPGLFSGAGKTRCTPQGELVGHLPVFSGKLVSGWVSLPQPWPAVSERRRGEGKENGGHAAESSSLWNKRQGPTHSHYTTTVM